MMADDPTHSALPIPPNPAGSNNNPPPHSQSGTSAPPGSNNNPPPPSPPSNPGAQARSSWSFSHLVGALIRWVLPRRRRLSSAEKNYQTNTEIKKLNASPLKLGVKWLFAVVIIFLLILVAENTILIKPIEIWGVKVSVNDAKEPFYHNWYAWVSIATFPVLVLLVMGITQLRHEQKINSTRIATEQEDKFQQNADSLADTIAKDLATIKDFIKPESERIEKFAFSAMQKAYDKKLGRSTAEDKSDKNASADDESDEKMANNVLGVLRALTQFLSRHR